MSSPAIVPRALVGHVDSPATPSLDPARLGSVVATADGPLRARGWATIGIRYTVGHHGLDDRGGLKIVMRFPYDGGDWQVEDPAAPNFVRVSASRPCVFRAEYKAFGDARPWFRVFRVSVTGGCLGEGDTIDLILGDRAGGSPGMRVQSFCEDAWELRVMVDPCATGHFQEVPGQVAFPVIPGPARSWRAVLPGRRPSESAFWLGLKAEDEGGNPSSDGLRRLRLRPSQPVEGLPELVEAWPGRALRLDGLTTGDGVLRVAMEDAETGESLGVSNPMIVGEPATWWADLHGQSGETVGINTADAWFHFGRDLSFLDACAHQANCFQINNAFWAELDRLSAAWNEPGRYVTLPGYEWSGNTAVGGDRNVWYRYEGRPIRRASHALLTDHSDAHTDATTATALFAALTAHERPGEVVVSAHVGGRHADLAYAHDGRWERVVEVHSAWGTFEWLLLDALALGHRVGVVANSDGHKGRPGASWPGAATFGAVGGLTAWAAPELSRDDLFEALRARRTWATSGSRIDLKVEVRPLGPARVFDEDPILDPASGSHAAQVLGHGAIAATRAMRANVSVRVRSPVGVVRVDVRAGAETVFSHRPDAMVRRQREDDWLTGLPPHPAFGHLLPPGEGVGLESPLLPEGEGAPAGADEGEGRSIDQNPKDKIPAGRRVRLSWEGAEYRGRGRQVSWDGSARLSGATIRRLAPFAAWNPEHQLVRDGDQIRWRAVTTGNQGGWDLWWNPLPGQPPHLDVETRPARLSVDLATLPTEGVSIDAGGLGRRLSLLPLPEDPLPCDVDFQVEIGLRPAGDTAIWVAITTEDGHQAWSSPIYLFLEAP